MTLRVKKAFCVVDWQVPSLSTLSETLRAELFTEPEGEYGEIEVEQEYWRRPAGFVGHGWRGA
jgi:hypothetical protein